jgi:competence/damage-inducible protein CinA-like protein
LRAEIISIGDELLIGQVINTNASWLGQRLANLGIEPSRVVTVSDDFDEIVSEIGAARDRSDVVIVTGGLGPTHDDITKEAVASLFGVKLEFHQDLFDELLARYQRAGQTISPSNRTQAEVPEGFEVLKNRWGSAPGLVHQARCMLVLLPGVPREMKGLMNQYIFPRLMAAGGLQPAIRKTLLTTGIAESRLHDDIGDISGWEARGCSLAYLPSIHGVRLRLTSAHPDVEAARLVLAEFESFIRGKADRHIFGVEEETLEAVVGELLVERGWTVGTAESCTSGLVASRLTDVPRASRYVRGGIVAYDNSVKIDALAVSESDLAALGAVSREVVTQMASGVRRALGADVGVATSGIMGPGGGSDKKPVGTLWIGVETPNHALTITIVMRHARLENKARGATMALDFLRRVLLKTAV